ncbi:hypothetical protein HYW60_00540 [Candidatus Kaiserbacteria bacterium]|nr:hypothetical protein [Candidatus Kaiserbacteria bacterium]
MDFSSGYTLVANFFSAIPTDWFIIGGIVLLSAFDCVRTGVRRVSQIALAFPLSALLMQNLPKAFILGEAAAQFSTPLMQALLLGFVFAVLYVLIGRIGISWGGEEGQPIQAALAGVASAGIVTTMWIATPALDSLWHFGPQVQEIFGEAYRFWWLLGSLAALAYVRG